MGGIGKRAAVGVGGVIVGAVLASAPHIASDLLTVLRAAGAAHA